ncbi:MAG: ribosome maturation factor RimM [Cellvibrionales bacterium]|nr:ribosome maturation factor RimM [Cellvibrionales bacterium]
MSAKDLSVDSESDLAAGLVVIGEISAVFGVKGWLKVHSYTEPFDNILAYDNWLLEKNGQTRQVVIDEARRHSNGIVVHIKDVHDRDIAKAYCKSQIKIPLSAMPELSKDDYYWHQLEGLQVYLQDEAGQAGLLIGSVDHLIETGANDVLVVKPELEGKSDSEEILIPYLLDKVVKSVDIDNGTMLVDWQMDDVD